MDTNANVIALPVPTAPDPVPPVEAVSRPSQAAENAERSARYRLVIEEGSAPGTFVYKTVDRETGEVVRMLPREDVVKLMQDDRYGAGSVFDIRA